MKLPTIRECEALFSKYHVPENFFLHCKKVAQVGIFLAVELKKKGIDVSIDLVERACLLHDLFKFVTLVELKAQPEFKATAPTKQQITSWKKLKEQFPGKFEGEIFYETFKDVWPELAKLLYGSSNPHRVIELGNKRTWDERIQHYADCRVLGDEVIMLEDRFKDAEKRYPDLYKQLGEKHKEEKKQIRKDEQEIFEIIEVSPDVLLKFNKDSTTVTIETYDSYVEQYYQGTKHYNDHHIYLTDSSPLLSNFSLAFLIDLLFLTAKTLYPHIPFFVMDMRKLNFPENSFDHIICNAALLHLEKKDIPSVLSSFYIILKPGGKLWIGVKKGDGENYELRTGTLKYVSKFNNKEIRRLVEQAKFHVLKQYDCIENRKGEKIVWIDILAQKPLKKEAGK